jgi:signal transduction histidine kinase/putative methionine-R-sulfoxide reductase with GAF domain
MIPPMAVTGDDLRRVAEEHAALRRVATLVAAGPPAAELFAAVAEEVAGVLDMPAVTVNRYEPDGTSTVVACFGPHTFTVGSRWPADGVSVSAQVHASAEPARIDDYDALGGGLAAAMREAGIRSGVGAPIVVEQRVWGMIGVASLHGPLPADTEDRLHEFTALVATAISNAATGEDLRRLAIEQASLRRVATLAAAGAAPADLFAAVAREVAGVLGVAMVTVDRYDGDASVVVASLNDPSFPVGSCWTLDGPSLGAAVFATGRSARIDDYAALDSTIANVARDAGVSSTVGVPIVVDGRTWGVICVGTKELEPLPPDTEERLGRFTALVATAISNIEARAGQRRLAEEQGALRRVATLVARGASPDEVLARVAQEVAEVLGVPGVTIDRYVEDGAAVVVVASHNAEMYPVGSRWPLDGPSMARALWERGGQAQAARIGAYGPLDGSIAAAMVSAGDRPTIGVPIIVDGGLWGMMGASAIRADPLAGDIEPQLRDFTELVSTAISNATARAELIASRARVVAAGDEARRRIERNLHDGIQQRLIALGLDLQAVRADVPAELAETHAGLERVGRELESTLAELRELSRGLHPTLLARSGLGPSLRALARRCPIPVTLDVQLAERPPDAVEVTVYYVVAEALTNAARHAGARRVAAHVRRDGSVLRASISDDGVGGADTAGGSGLIGLVDRVEALGGRLDLASPPGAGTTIVVALPLASPAGG